ncbi:hypothetical protein [Deinococcus sp. YIM 77859]|uniref:hypothetical protein n=1 Tax=Deinococcus sp. YIM 77859 TaxID=1540221 RepID=UPI00054DD3F8|nr:hypothetical protein [Deinococcus sp. YIM 77859]
MKQVRYIITRPCLQEGSLRLLKYLDSTFPESGPVLLVDERGREYTAEVDRAAGRVWGLRNLYHDGNLGVNDVLLLTPLAPGRYQVEAVVKPHPAPLPASRTTTEAVPEARRVVVTATPHVREVRLEQPRSQEGQRSVTELPRRVHSGTAPEKAPEASAARVHAPAPGQTTSAPQGSPAEAGRERAASRAAVPLPSRLEDQLAELARLTGYRLTFPVPQVARLAAELGTYGYTVQLALEPAALHTPRWREGADYALLVTGETERPQGQPHLTREALAALIEHARLAPLSPLDLRGYWQAGHLDLESAASISELVGAHLAQRGAFSFVLLTLAAHPAHSVINVSRLAERLGSGVNIAELRSILDTLTRAPFLALTPLSGGEYLLRTEIRDLLADLADYADGLRRRVRQPAAVNENAAPV